MMLSQQYLPAFPPFEKGGKGGFAFGMRQGQKQIPLNPPFSKGEGT
jgi:hypothetical protein